MYITVDENYLSTLKILRDEEVKNNPEYAEFFKEWRGKQIKEVEDIISKAAKRKSKTITAG